MSHIGGKEIVNADDVVWQQDADDDITASLEHGCLKLGDDEIDKENNQTEPPQRQRFAVGTCVYN